MVQFDWYLFSWQIRSVCFLQTNTKVHFYFSAVKILIWNEQILWLYPRPDQSNIKQHFLCWVKQYLMPFSKVQGKGWSNLGISNIPMLAIGPSPSSREQPLQHNPSYPVHRDVQIKSGNPLYQSIYLLIILIYYWFIYFILFACKAYWRGSQLDNPRPPIIARPRLGK